MSCFHFLKYRPCCFTFFHAMLTAVLERASVRNVQRTWCLTLNTLDLFVLIHMNGKLCSQKCLCIRMERVFRNILPRNYLYNISKIHSCDLMSKRTNQPRIRVGWRLISNVRYSAIAGCGKRSLSPLTLNG